MAPRTRRLFHITSLAACMAACSSPSQQDPAGGNEAGQGGAGEGGGDPAVGGAGGADLCSADACGGDLQGAWAYTDTCAVSTTAEGGCSGSDVPMVTTTTTRLEGTLSFHDGVVDVSRTIVVRTEEEMPIGCVGFNGCEHVHDNLGVPAECAQSGETCFCSYESASGPATASEPYVVADLQVTIGDASSPDSSFSYCVAGERLVLVHESNGEIVTAERER